MTLGLRGAPPSTEFQEDWGRDARALLERCLLPDLDVLLPRAHAAGAGKQFFVAAFADDVDASVLVNRIRSQFVRHGHLDESGLTLSISHHVLSAQQDGTETSDDLMISTLASTLEAAIESQILNGCST